MEVVQPLGEHEVVLLLLQLGLLLLVARGLGQLAVRYGLPSVVGELLAGVVLGPSLLGAVAPGLFAAIVPADPGQFHLLEVVSLLGVILLLIVTGLETDIELIVRKGRSAAAISLFGIVVPFAAGFALGQVLPADFIADTDQRLVFSLFLGTAMGISAIPVIAKVLIEMGVVRRDIGQITLAAGMIDDTIGWILLSVVAGLARSGTVDVPAVGQAILSVVVVVGVAFTAGRRLVGWLFREVDNRIGGEAAKISLLMVLALLGGSLTHFLGIEAVLGAFMVGILAGQVRRFDHHSREIVETITLAVFAPIFFAASGLRVDLAALLDPTVLGVGLLVLAVAIAGKFVGAAMGARISGLGRWEALSLGAGMNARGAIEIIVATIGLSLGILTQEMFTIILLVAITTSLMAPPLLRWTLKRVPMGEEERARLEAEDRQATSFVGNLNRVLLPTRGGRNSRLAARLLALMLAGLDDVEVTTMSVVDGSPRGRREGGDAPAPEPNDADKILSNIDVDLVALPASERRRLVQHRSGDVVETILLEARRGYDLLALGATENGDHNGHDAPLFGRLIDRLVQNAPGPVFVVSHRSHGEVQLPLRRLLLPITGSGRVKHAHEVAFALAAAAEATVEVVHVVHEEDDLATTTIAEELMRAVAEQANAAGASVRTHLERASRPELGILATAERLHADLVILSPALKPLSQRAFFGHGVDHILAEATCPVVIVS